ncbi:MAG: response regulator [Burkholderiales bacterium]|nr:response regulator [Burkholderiales bacterium]
MAWPKHPKLLLVDDEEELLWSLTERIRLARPSFVVKTACDGQAALERLTVDPPDVVVADIRMPRMNGLELVVAARSLRPSLPVVVMTAYPAGDVFEEIKRRGSIDYLEKPFDFERFLSLVEGALERTEASRGFHGAIQVQTLPDIVQLYALSNATGALHVAAAGGDGVIWFERGAIPHAVAGALVGTQAFFEIMGFRGGRFSMDLGAPTPARTIELPWMELVMEACRLHDEDHRDAPEVDDGWTLVPPPASQPPSQRAEDTPRSRPRNATNNAIDKENDMANVKDSLSKLDSIDGFVGACLCDSESGMVLGTEGGGPMLNLEVAGATNTEVVRAKRKAAKALGLKDDIEDILITLGKQYHLIRPLRSKPQVFFYLALDRGRANLGMARLTLADAERDLVL